MHMVSPAKFETWNETSDKKCQIYRKIVDSLNSILRNKWKKCVPDRWHFDMRAKIISTLSKVSTFLFLFIQFVPDPLQTLPYHFIIALMHAKNSLTKFSHMEKFMLLKFRAFLSVNAKHHSSIKKKFFQDFFLNKFQYLSYLSDIRNNVCLMHYTVSNVENVVVSAFCGDIWMFLTLIKTQNTQAK